jgi:Fe2+ transport system protein FeoA
LRKKPQALTDFKEGQEVIITGIDAGVTARQRLTDMGLTPGVKLKIKESAPFRGPVCVEVRGSKLALGRCLASKVKVVEE